jgi:hypothetical protein
VCRAAGKIPRAAAVLTTCSALEVAAAAAGGVAGGLIGLSFALLAVRYLEALVTTPPVVRAAFGHGRHRRGESLTVATTNPAPDAGSRGKPHGSTLDPAPDAGSRGKPHGPTLDPAPGTNNQQRAYSPALTDTTERERQQAGIAALLSLATLPASTHPIPVIPASMLRPAPVPTQESAAYRRRTPPAQ